MLATVLSHPNSDSSQERSPMLLYFLFTLQYEGCDFCFLLLHLEIHPPKDVLFPPEAVYIALMLVNNWQCKIIHLKGTPIPPASETAYSL